MPEYQIIDKETGNTYIINLAEEEFLRTSTDLEYCTKLLQKAKAEENNENIVREDSQSDISEIYNDGFRWVDKAIRLLLATYKHYENLLSTGKVSVKKFWEIISTKLNEKSYNVTGQQCKSKFNGLKKTYKNVKDYNNKSGNNKQTWSYFEIMDEMFGHKPWVTPVLTLDSSNRILFPASPTNSSSSHNSGTNSCSSTISSCSLSASIKEGPRKRQKTQNIVLEELLTIMQENKEEKKRMHEEAVARQDRLLDLLEKIAKK